MSNVHLNILILATIILWVFYFLAIQHSHPYVIAGLTTERTVCLRDG